MLKRVATHSAVNALIPNLQLQRLQIDKLVQATLTMFRRLSRQWKGKRREVCPGVENLLSRVRHHSVSKDCRE